MTDQPQDTPAAKNTTVSFGQRLRREREMRGIKLEDIAESTKIGKRNLVALEEEQFDQLPGGIFNKGFVRAYAKYLGLDEEQAVNDFLVASANYDQPAALQPPPTSWVKAPAMPSDDAISRRNRVRVLLVALLLVGGFAGWLYWKSGQRATAEESIQGAAQTLPANSPATSSDSQSRATQGQSANRGAAPGVSEPEEQSSSQANSSSAAGVPVTAGSEPRKPIFTVRIEAKEDTWVNVTSDGKQVMDLVIPAGQARVIHAKQELVLRTGNAAGIEVAHNGVPIGPVGSQKQVKTLTFNASGLAH